MSAAARRLALLSLLALFSGIHPAAAAFTVVTLHNVVFSDGGTASGTFSPDILGYPDADRTIVTSTGSVLSGTACTAAGESPGHGDWRGERARR